LQLTGVAYMSQFIQHYLRSRQALQPAAVGFKFSESLTVSNDSFE
jgi:hypothetical protein